MPFFSPLWARAAARRVAAPRARHDVGDDAAAAARAARPHDRVPRRAAALPAHADRHAVGVVEATSSCASCTSRPRADHGRAARHRPVVLAGRRAKSPTPLVVAVGRLVPVKRFDLLIDALRRRARRAHPQLAGGDRRRGLRARRARSADRASSAPSEWISLPGRVDDDDARSTCTGARGSRERVGARGLGHDDHRGRGVRHARGRDPDRRATPTRSSTARTGLLVDDRDELARRARPRARRRRAARAAARPARSRTRPQFTWGATARGTLEVLAAEALRRGRS